MNEWIDQSIACRSVGRSHFTHSDKMRLPWQSCTAHSLAWRGVRNDLKLDNSTLWAVCRSKSDFVSQSCLLVCLFVCPMDSMFHRIALDLQFPSTLPSYFFSFTSFLTKTLICHPVISFFFLVNYLLVQSLLEFYFEFSLFLRI